MKYNVIEIYNNSINIDILKKIINEKIYNIITELEYSDYNE